MQASAALVEMTAHICPDLAEVDLYVADCGPGSFIGVRVAVTLAKSLAWANGKQCAAVTSFDLIAPDQVVSFPSRRGEYFIRGLDGSISLSPEKPAEAVGFGPDFESPTYPDPARVAALWDRLTHVDPKLLVPNYVLEPSISTPKTPYATSGTT